MGRLIHLAWGEAASAHRNVVLVEDGTDGAAVDAEPVAQLIGRRARRGLGRLASRGGRGELSPLIALGS